MTTKLLLTWVLLQVRLDVVISGYSSLSAAVSADGILLGFYLLSCTFESLLGSSSGQDEQRIPHLQQYLIVGSNVRTTNNNQAVTKLKTANWTISTLLFLINIYFLPFSFVTIKSTGGAFGYGLLVLPISLSINLLLISAGLTFKTKFNKSIGLLIINGLGILWSLFWLWLLLTTPRIN